VCFWRGSGGGARSHQQLCASAPLFPHSPPHKKTHNSPRKTNPKQPHHTRKKQYGDARERTDAQFRALLAASGFELARVVPTKGMFSVVEAAPV
jgi:hypothetical protein